MNKDAPTPPDMTREQARELKTLRAREARLNRQLGRAAIAASHLITLLERRINNECGKVRNAHRRAANRECKALAAPLRAEQRQARTLARRLAEGRTPEQREWQAVAKRIAILEGRLGS